MVRISNFLVFIMGYVIILLFHSYVCSYVFEQKRKTRFFKGVKLVYWIGGAGIFLVILSQFTNLYYYFDTANIYHRNWIYPLSMLPGAAGIVVDLFLLVKYRGKIKRQIFISMISYITLPAIALVIQTFHYGMSLTNIAINISMIFLLISTIAEQGRELYELKRDIMLCQMKPHFIYNTLTTIKHLCKTEPETAVETIDEFARYVRGNLDALTMKKNIPFEWELEHVKSYLAIEKKRFGNRIHIVYKIEATDIFLPALTLQPIVENAVKHGITKKLEGGTIHISSSTERDDFIIRIKDDGVGFKEGDVFEKNNECHVGIHNVRSRIESMCNGKMNVYSVLGEGTEVEIRLPIRKVKTLGQQKRIKKLN